MTRKMKDSGIEWIGEIPEEWVVRPALYAFSEIRTKNTDGAIKKALKFYNGTIIPKMNFDADSDDYVADTITNYTIVRPDVIMINGLNLNYDLKSLRVGIVKDYGVITPAYLALWPDKSRILPSFATYLFKGYETRMAFHNMGAGIRKTLGFKEFKRQPILLPPMQEQTRIASYLDTQCAKIDAVLEQTRQSIEEYKRLKQAVITRAVTKGIRPGRKMKDSGDMWLGDIPEEWKLSRVGLHFDIILGKMLCSVQLSEDYSLEPYYCAANIHFDGISDSDMKQMWFSSAEKAQYLVKPGDLLVVEGGAGAGGCAIVETVSQPAYIQNSIMIVRPKQTANVYYLRYLLECIVKCGYIDVVCNKATIPHFTKDKLAGVPFPVSKEQGEIADYLIEKCTEIDAVVAKKEMFISQLEYYKKSIVYECVTGKKTIITECTGGNK